jgi:hypothetical protein
MVATAEEPSMRFLMSFKMPHEPFNKLVREGVAGQKLGRVVEETRPEQIYFTERDGFRAGVAVYEIKDTTGMCAIAEPWFLTFAAECRFSLAMSPEDLSKVGLEELGKRWA